jgi:methylmalonyl-CoA mutase cobalamin-binding subunit
LKTIVAAAIGECVHVAGVINFLRLAEKAGWRAVFLGPAVAPERLIEVARQENADLVGVSYRLTPETGERLLGEFAEAADELHQQGVRFVFGGTPPVAERAKAMGFFEAVFDGSELVDSVLAYLRGQKPGAMGEMDFPQKTIERIQWKQPYPLLRHHYGQPTLEATIKGIQQIAQAKALDVISLGIDQDAQANFFHPERQNPRQKGAGGVPVRSAEGYRALYAASRTGNYPLMRSYSGTDDFLRLAQLYKDTINIAWCAIPIFWFNQMDGRGPWGLEESIRKHQEVMAWYGEQGIPVELNEPHHWGMRDAPDVIFVVSAYLSAYNAKKFGVGDYIAQMMFNSPPGTSDAMDLAKMLACMVMTEPLQDDHFHIWRQTRTGLLSYPLQEDAARAHLSASIYLQMALKPHILHIVGHTEAHHAATANDIIVASRMARQAIENASKGQPAMTHDPAIQNRVEALVTEAQVTLAAIRDLAKKSVQDPFTDPGTLTKAVQTGILDAPHLKNNPFARGLIQTRIQNGACVAIDSGGNPLSERERLNSLNKEVS